MKERTPIELLRSALSDIECLKNEIAILVREGKTVKDLIDIFDSFNVTENELFDMNFGVLVATIKYNNNGEYHVGDRFDIWNDDGQQEHEYVTKKEIEKRIKDLL